MSDPMKPVLMSFLLSFASVILGSAGCYLVEPNAIPDFSIETDSSSYVSPATSFIFVTFSNNLDRDVKIYNSTCGPPLFELEKYDGNKWKFFEGLPICEIPQVPITLGDGHEIKAGMDMSLMSGLIPGTYRMKFVVKDAITDVSVDDAYVYSNGFTIIR